MKLKKTWEKLKKIAKSGKMFWVGFVTCWLALESPAIVGVIFYFLTQDGWWLGLFTGWVALTAPTLPIPVVPISIAVGVATQKIDKKIKKRKERKWKSNSFCIHSAHRGVNRSFSLPTMKL